ncbi:DEAD/DEAH box helicase [Fibrella forsythiae]|uniref:DEAD/DEAH box helicase n=1 Tax=Fibrella forsythiae TaxID=2817061 RepID=A0ABS3JND8_9BACT|nr:DEAD/DEAH box helicase [Fibrella forsythiae]MBO0950714.1 DEAD/DEAH box helicase [Fibrella forsythiae]
MNYKQATPIQEQAIPLIQEGKDLIACAQTGTGKTAAFLIPLLDKIAHAEHDHTSTLVLVPTRELAKQIDDQVEGFSYFVSATSIAIYGGGKGDDWDKQRKALETGADIIIATPGRLIAHMQMGYVNFDKLNYLVLDEADKMLDMGFSDDILKIVATLPKERQTLLFSATMPPKIRTLASQLLTSPEEIRLSVSKPAAGIDQQIYLAKDHQKLPLLEHLMGTMDVKSMVLFTSRKSEVNAIVRALAKRGYVAKGISSDLEQEEREVVLREFKNKQLQIIVATDVLSRGIDVDNITHVVNYDVPRDAEDYVHRIGRTARAATTGTAITFVNEADMNKLGRIEKLIERKLDRLSITEELGYGPGPVAGVRDEPGPFDRGRSNGRGGREAGRNGRGNSGRHNDSSRGGRPDRPAGDRSPRPEMVAAPLAEDVPVPVELADGTAAPRAERDPNRRNNRRRNRGPRPAGEQPVVVATAGHELNEIPLPATDGQTVSGEASKPKRKKRRKSRPKQVNAGENPVESASDGVVAAKAEPEAAVTFAPISTWRDID